MKRALPFVVVALLAGCGENHGAAVSSTHSRVTTTDHSPTTTAGEQRPVRVLLYLIDHSDEKLVAYTYLLKPTAAIGAEALHALSDLNTQVPPNLSLKIVSGNAQVTGAAMSPGAFAQVVFTLTQFPTIKTVNGKTRADVEGFVPAILVEHPTSTDTVKSPIRVTGNANTFEATFEYDLKDANGKVIAHHFVTATSGNGPRGTFDFEIPFTVDSEQDGTLVVFESSAKDGSRIHIREIPLRLKP
jgi:hypothetical protein